MINIFKIALVISLLYLTSSNSFAFTTSLFVQNGFLEPSGWAVGDPHTTHQVWDSKTEFSGEDNLPDMGYNSAGETLIAPTHSVRDPGFRSGTNNFYSFEGDYSAYADITNHGGAASGLGTHVVVQIGASLNGGVGVYLSSIGITESSGNAITGGGNSDALQIAEVSFQVDVFTSFGPADYVEIIFEFWLPGYTDDFRVDWDQRVHATIDTLRVDSIIASELPGGGSPFAFTTSTPGDLNSDSIVDAADYSIWRDGGSTSHNYDVWAQNFGTDYSSSSSAAVSVPEPSSTSLIMMFGMTVGFCGWMSWFTRPPR